jgi:hypothetical protein
MPSTTERGYAVKAFRALALAGWVLETADNGEEEIRPTSVTAAVEHVEACEECSITMTHPEHGSATFCLLFQGGEPNEVIYDYWFKTGAENVIDQILDSLEKE